MKRNDWVWQGVRSVLVAGALSAVSPVHAAEGSGGYFGVSAGQVMAQDYCDSEAGLSFASCDDKDTAYRVFGGYKFHSNLAIEGAYVNLGNYPASGTYLGTPFNVDVEITGFTVQAVGMVPLGDYFTLLGRAGAILWNIDSSAQVFGLSGAQSEDGADLALGIGGQFNFNRNAAIRADLDLYPSLGNEDSGESDLTMVSVGLVFSF